MKYVFVVFALLAFICVGCYDGYYWGGRYPRHYERTRPQATDDVAGDELARAPAEPIGPPDAPPGEEPPTDQPDPEDGPPLERPPSDGPVIVEETQRRIEITPRQPRLVKAPGKVRHDRRMALGFSLGNVYGVSGEAIDDYDDSEFGNGMYKGLSFVFLPEVKEKRWSPNFITRYGIEVRLQDHSMMLDDRGTDLGELHTTGMLFLFKLYQMPRDDGAFGFHFDIGLGWGWTWFEKADMLKQEDWNGGRHTKIDVDNAQMFALGGGIDLTVGPDAWVSLDFRFEALPVPVKWSVDGTYSTQVDAFYASNSQIILSLFLLF
jgi:hypothetical protein